MYENLMFQKNITGSNWQVFKIPEVDNSKCPKQFYQRDNIGFAVYDTKIARRNDLGIWEIVATANGSSKYISKILPGTDMIGYILETASSEPNHLFISLDTGRTWIETNIDSLFQDNLHLHTGLSPVLIIGQNIIGYNFVPRKQMYISSDFGKSWQVYGEGLPETYIASLYFDEEYIYATTHGAGVYRRHIEDLPTSISSLLKTEANVSIDPNPNKGRFSVTIPNGLTQGGIVFIHDLQGKLIFSTAYHHNGSIDIQLPNVSPGQYVLSLQSEGLSATSRIILVQ